MNEARFQTTLEEFARLWRIARQAGVPVWLVGGHAVNLWAAMCLDKEPELRQFLPFTSRDLDLMGDATALEALAAGAGSLPVRAKPGSPSPVLGHFPFKLADGRTSCVEILFTLNGVTREEIVRGAAQIALPQTDTIVQLPSPLICLKAKLHNAAQLDQAGRQDVKHVRMLLLCNRAVLRDTLMSCEQQRLPPRIAVNALEALLALQNLPPARQVTAAHNLDWQSAYPVAQLQATPIEALQRFYDLRFRAIFTSCPPRKPS